MMRRRGGPGILSTMARTAVIAGTATANRVNARAAARAQGAQQPAAQMQEQLAAQEAAIGAAEIDDTIGKLKELAQLKDAGMLTEEEFSLAKAKVLGG